MITISHKTQNLNFSEDVVRLLCQIDKYLAKESENKLNASRFGARICFNAKDFQLLSKYRTILANKANHDCCLKDFLIDDIIARIKQLLNRN
jgi:hypothetical protein